MKVLGAILTAMFLFAITCGLFAFALQFGWNILIPALAISFQQAVGVMVVLAAIFLWAALIGILVLGTINFLT